MNHLTKTELEALLVEARIHSEQDWLMLLVSYWHGLRASEVVNLTGAQIRDGHITIQRLKGSNRTVQPLTPEECGPLHNLADAVGPRGRLFPICRKTFWQRLQRYGKAAGIASHKCHPHVLKHSIAMHTIKQAGIENVRQYLGHKSIASTGAYLKVSDDEASLAIAAAMGARL